jgi:hypothetical protein
MMFDTATIMHMQDTCSGLAHSAPAQTVRLGTIANSTAKVLCLA